MAKIIIIEDEKDIRDLMSFQLKSGGHEVIGFDDVGSFISSSHAQQKCDLFVLDWMLPGSLSGVQFCRELRKNPQYQQTPIIMVTALSQSENIVQGLDAGADDYITKPFDIHVFQARVRSQLRPLVVTQNPDDLQFAELNVNLSKCKVLVDNSEIQLTSTEFKILTTLIQQPGHVFTREQMISKIQGENIYVTGRTVDTHIAGLRKKLGRASRMIETIRGIGYRFSEENKN